MKEGDTRTGVCPAPSMSPSDGLAGDRELGIREVRDTNPSPDHKPGIARPQSDSRRFWGSALRFSLLTIITWSCLFALDRSFPYLRPGSDVIHAAKLRAVNEGGIFRRDVPIRVVAVGNSRTLAGFDPGVFSECLDTPCQAYNLGLPGTNQYVAPLRTMIGAGDVPTHVLIQAPWPKPSRRLSPLGLLRQDADLIRMLFPFRDLPRNLAIFLVASHSRGGIRDYYLRKQETAQEAVAARGYYFIEGQSRFEDDRLPDQFSLSADRPDTVYVRPFEFDALALAELLNIGKEHRIQFIIIPEYYREKAFAEPPPVNPEVVGKSASIPGLMVLGPDYWRFPNRLFSDAVHLNREGAGIYTRRLAHLVGPVLATSTYPSAGLRTQDKELN